MTTPRQDIPDWDSAADEQDALRSLDVTDINATLHDRVIEDPYVPAVTVPASAQTTRVVPNVPTITEPAQQVQETGLCCCCCCSCCWSCSFSAVSACSLSSSLLSSAIHF